MQYLQYVLAFMKLLSLSLSLFFQDGKFNRAEGLMPADPPAVKIVGQSSFVDFGENDRDWCLVFAVIFDRHLVCLCVEVTE